jgi:antitoxin YefM
MQFEIVGVYGNGRILEIDNDLDGLAFCLGAKVEQGMFVKAQLKENAVETGIGRIGHPEILKQVTGNFASLSYIRTGKLYCTILLMTETTYTSLRQDLASVLDRVANDHEVVIVRRRGARTVAMVPADELMGLIETAHLLRSPKNAQRLLKSLGRAVQRKGKPEPLEKLRQELRLGSSK